MSRDSRIADDLECQRIPESSNTIRCDSSRAHESYAPKNSGNGSNPNMMDGSIGNSNEGTKVEGVSQMRKSSSG